jgi:glycosyltransferase involved in cell wall biosynthesis
MKIAMLSDYSVKEYLEYGQDKFWGTPRGIYDAFKTDLRVNEIRWYPTPSDDKSFGFVELKKQYESKEFIPDIILWMSCGLGSDELFTKENFKHSKLVVDCGDEPQTVHYNQKRVKNADFILTPDVECYLKYKSMNYEVIFTSHWSDLNIFYPSFTSYEPFDVVTSMNGERGEALDYLQEKLGSSFYLKNNLKDIENGDLYRNGKIVFQKSRYGEVTRRIFEGMSCKKLVITDRLNPNKQLGDIFIENEEIVFYSSKEEALEKIQFYLNNEQERNRIAENGYKKVIDCFTTKNIVEYILTGKDK